MSIEYRDTKSLPQGELQELFLSVGWSSGHYPDKLGQAMKNSGFVYSAWDQDKLVGLVNVLEMGL